MSEEEIKQLMKEEVQKTIKENLHSEMIFVYVDNLEKENKQLKEEIKEYKRIEQKDLEAFNNYDSILTELEECLIKITKNGADIEKLTCSNILVYLKELKEKYKC